MDARRALHRTNGRVIVKPFVVLAARCLGPGRLRLEMVKLAHDLAEREYLGESSLYGRSARERRVFDAQDIPARRRAA
jgi:hypothetical protein